MHTALLPGPISYIVTKMKAMIHFPYSEGDYRYVVCYFLTKHNMVCIKQNSGNIILEAEMESICIDRPLAIIWPL